MALNRPQTLISANVRFGSEADMCGAPGDVCFVPKADITAYSIGASARTTSDPNAFHLRAMNMLYEGLKQNSTIVIVPSTAVESMQLGSIAGLTALTMGLGQKGASKPPSGGPVPQA